MRLYDKIRPFAQFVLPFLVMWVLIVIGTVGYILIENYRFLDAFYMTIITVATVGYGEVAPLSDAGRIFTSFLIITSFGTFAYAVSAITRFVVDGEFNNLFKQQKLNSAIEKLTDHVIICGYGRNGRQAAQVLKKHDKRFVVIEKNPELTETLNHRFKDLVISGDSTQDETLIKAGILRAKALITTLPVDADNMFIVLTARNLNPKLTIISRASDDGSDTKIKIAGADNVIMPDKVGGAHMASLVMKPDVMEFIDYVTAQGGDNNNLEEITFSNIPEHLKDKTLKDLEIRNKSGANIIGFKTGDGKYVINPSADTQIIPEAKIFVLGTPDQIKKLKEILT
ncbi:MAG: potassium channel protein [Sphingobacteriaceae bacterium]|nr:potassium channel protein [Sphingobacteriaceae bacterium]MBK7816537.1 potassium channel protein [Sphingobacteriaceae bacterium]